MGFLFGYNEETETWEKYKEPFKAVRVSATDLIRARIDANDSCEYATYLIRDKGNHLRCNNCGFNIPREDGFGGEMEPNWINYCWNCGAKFLRSVESDE